MGPAARPAAALGPLALALLLILSAGRHSKSEARVLTQAGETKPAPDVKSFARAGCGNATALATWEPFRPGYHITPPWGWLNDPHGLFKRQGLHHLFFQYNPKSTAWGAPFWGHVVSEDMARWRWLPPALLPDGALDYNGAWSGAATVAEDGTPWLSYTAASTFVPELGNFFQTQALASPADPSDPLLREWRKLPSNPVLMQTPPGGTNFQFRDTTPANTDVRDAVAAALAQRGGANAGAPRYAWAVGTQAFCLGAASLYTAPKLEGPWTFAGNLFNQLAIDSKLNGQCDAIGNKSNSAAFGGPCNQFGKCRMWEVTDFAKVAPGVYAVKWSDQQRTRDPFSAEFYVLSDELDPKALKPQGAGPGNYNDISAAGASAFDTLLTGRLGGRPFTPLRLDYGSTYASKFERMDDGRLIINTWVMDSFIGCIDSCSENKPEGDAYVKKAKFKGVLQLPRLVTYSPEARSLVLFPIDEVKKLRGKQSLDVRDRPLPGPDAPLPLLEDARLDPQQPGRPAGGPAGAAARQFHARLVFNVTPPAAAPAGQQEPGQGQGQAGAWNFTLGARLLTGPGSHVDVLLEGTAAAAGAGAGAGGAAALTSLRVAVDKRRAGGFTPAAVEGGPVPVPPSGGGGGAGWLLPGKALSLDLFVDHSVVEVYAIGGLGRVTSRIYPSDEATAWGLAAFASWPRGAAARLAAAEAWPMANAWAGQPALC